MLRGALKHAAVHLNHITWPQPNYRQRSLSLNQDLFKNCGRNETMEFWSYNAIKMALRT